MGTGALETFAHLRYFDWQAGVRLDLDSGPARAWAALGMQGLPPYFFNFAPTQYVRDRGRVAGRIQGSYDLYVTQRVILQPQVELNFYSQADRGRGIGTGLSELDSGLRLGYQFSRKFAPYIGYAHSGVFGQTATFSLVRPGNQRVHLGWYLGFGCGTDQRVLRRRLLSLRFNGEAMSA